MFLKFGGVQLLLDAMNTHGVLVVVQQETIKALTALADRGNSCASAVP